MPWRRGWPIARRYASRSMGKEAPVPAGRLDRLWQYGGLAAGLGLGAMKHVLKGDKQGWLMNEENVERLVQTLCRMRGAALKLGQMLSLQDNALLPPAVQTVMERVRAGADPMPTSQLERVLARELGAEWASLFRAFELRPIAAASIGQVHRAELRDGSAVAVKVQYPGVAESIDSDLNNLKALLTFAQLLPRGMYLENTIRVAQRELSWEVDYVREAACMERFRYLLRDDPHFIVPHVIRPLSTRHVLTMDFVEGVAIDGTLPLTQAERNQIGERLLGLSLRELFAFRFMQTDPNWTNFLYQRDSQKIVLLDFGATRDFPSSFTEPYLRIIQAAAAGDRDQVRHCSQQLGFLTGDETKTMEEAHVDAVMVLGEPFASSDPYDFAAQRMTARIHQLIPIMVRHRLTPPPDESYSLHRKLSGAFLLCARLRAVFACRPLLDCVAHDGSH